MNRWVGQPDRVFLNLDRVFGSKWIHHKEDNTLALVLVCGVWGCGGWVYVHTYMAPLCFYSTCPALPQRNLTGIRNHFSTCNRTPGARSLISSSSDTRKRRVFVLSDLHTDYSDNMSWVRSLKSRSTEDLLLVAGDVAETYSNFILTMSLLKDEFHRVFFVPGNHDLWLRGRKLTM